MAAKSKAVLEKEYLSWLNELPRETKQNPDGSWYVPISIVQEDLLHGYRGSTKFELFQSYNTAGYLFGTGRLHYRHPGDHEWLFQDGMASIPYTGNHRLEYPALGAHILLNAAKKIGIRFGQQLNRDIETGLVIPDIDTAEPKYTLPTADDKILEKYKAAESAGDTGTMSLLSNMYKIPPTNA